MAAGIDDKFLEASANWTGAIGSGGVADGTVTTVPLVSVTNLPTDTAVEVMIDRVDSNGTLTPTSMEVVKGIVSSTNLISCERGTEGTAQAHSAGAIVEVILTADQWNLMTGGILVEHEQDGTHATSIVLTSPVIREYSGWQEANETWTYASATTFTISGDQTSLLAKGIKLKLTNSTVKYFYVKSSSYSSPDTTVTVTGGSDYTLADTDITSPFYSYEENPQSFPNGFDCANRQHLTVSSGGQMVLSGWDFVTGDGSNKRELSTVVFEEYFDSVPFVLTSMGSFKNGSDPTSLNELNESLSNSYGDVAFNCCWEDITASQFKATVLNSGVAWTATHRIGFTWQATNKIVD